MEEQVTETLYKAAEVAEVLRSIVYLFITMILMFVLLIINHWIYIFLVNQKMKKALKMIEEEKTQSKDCAQGNFEVIKSDEADKLR